MAKKKKKVPPPDPNGRLVAITTAGVEIPIYIPNTALAAAKEIQQTFMFMNHLLSRWMFRREPDFDPRFRAMTVAIVAWGGPEDALRFFKSLPMGTIDEPVRAKQIGMVEAIAEAFPPPLGNDLVDRLDLQDIVAELYEDKIIVKN